MIHASKAFLAAALAAVFFGLAACASQQVPAEQAFAALETRLKESGAEIQKYLPERYAELEKTVASLGESLANKDYGDVVKGAAAAQESIKRAVADARVERAKMLAAMDSEWNELIKTMPAMITAMDKKISSQRGRPPQGMTSDAWKATIAEYDAARDAWSKAASEMSTKTFEATVLTARDAKAKIAGIMESLGVKAS